MIFFPKTKRLFSFKLFLFFFLFLALASFSSHAQTTKASSTSSFLTKELKTQHFTLRFPPEQAWLARRIAKKMEADYTRIASELDYNSHSHFEIRLARLDKDYESIQPHAWKPHAWIAGLAYPRQGLMTLRQQPGQGFDQLYQTFVHELSHLLLFRAAHFQPMPLWFIEGVAMQQSNDYTAFDRFLTIARAQVSGSIPAISSLTKRFPADGGGATLAYAVSFTHLQFLRAQHPELLQQLLQQLRKGKSFDQALTQILGRSHASLLPKWKEYLRTHYHWLALIANEGLLWAILCLLLPLFYFRQKSLRKEQIAEMSDDPFSQTTEATSTHQEASLSYQELRKALSDDRE